MPGIITIEHPLRPNGLYGAMKGYLELMGTYYASRGLEVVTIRFGGVRLDDRMVDEPGYHSIWLSRRDCGRIIFMALDAKLAEPYVAVFAVSNNRHRVHDLTSSRRSLGFEPVDSAEKNE
jgi:uronate dehydrogenase